MEERSCSLPTELWHPYSEPESTRVKQVCEGIAGYSADNENYSANSAYTPRHVRVVFGS